MSAHAVSLNRRKATIRVRRRRDRQKPSEGSNDHEGHDVSISCRIAICPPIFPKGLASAWVDAPWWEYGDANKVTDVYNWSIDELMLAAKLGFDGVGTNEHHQNPYGFMCNPNLFGAILAKMTRDQGLDHVALVQLGATISPPARPSASPRNTRCSIASAAAA